MGNSVYPDYAKGNWAEGLTAYLSDHLLKEQRGQGADYRKTTLQKYTDYVTTAKDLPLTAFTSRHSSATEAVGYGKAMMLFHMLRADLGDATFKEALQTFYRRYRFAQAGFTELQASFEEVAGRSLATEFEQWVVRSGAPQLVIEDAAMETTEGRYMVSATLRQVQDGPAFSLRIPAAVTLAGESAARETEIFMNTKKKRISFSFTLRPLRLDIDPRHDVFRKLARSETPPALSQIFGAAKVVFVLPAAASAEERAAYRTLAGKLGQAGPETSSIVLDRELETLPADASVVLLGWKNRFSGSVENGLAAYDRQETDSATTWAGEHFDHTGKSVVVSLRHPGNSAQALAWIAASDMRALPGLARKLPHYHKYSYLAFRGEEPENVTKGRWPVLNSPMTLFFTAEKPPLGELPARAVLIDLPVVDSK